MEVSTGDVQIFDFNLCLNGTVPSCYGQNPETPYGIAKLSDMSLEDSYLGKFSLGRNEVLMVHGLTPYPCIYWSFILYLYSSDLVCDSMDIFGSLTDSVSNGYYESKTGCIPYNQPFTILYTYNWNLLTDTVVNDIIRKYNLSGPIFLQPFKYISEQTKYMLVERTTFFESPADQKRFIHDTRQVLKKLRFDVPFDPVDYSYFIPRNPNGSELDYLPVFQHEYLQFMNKITKLLPDHYLCSPVDMYQFPYDSGQDCVDMCVKCLGDNRDSVYTFGFVPKQFTQDDILVVFGVNANAFNLSTYMSVTVYDIRTAYGLKAYNVLDKESKTYSVVISKKPVDIGLPNIIVPKEVRLIGIVERAYVHPETNHISAEPKNLIPPNVHLLCKRT